MKHEFTKILKGDETRYILDEFTSGSSTSAASVGSGSVVTPLGGVRRRGDNLLAQEAGKNKVPATTPRNFVAKNAKTGGAGAHKDKKKAEKQGNVKHKKPFAEQGVAEGLVGDVVVHNYTKMPIDLEPGQAQIAGWGPNDEPLYRVKGQDGKEVKTWSKRRMLTIAKEQGVAEGFNGEYDDEAGMAHSNLLTTARAVMGLLKTIKDRDNLPEWGQEKIAKAEMMLVSVWDYLQSQKELGNDPQVDEARMSAAVRLARAADRQRAKSDASLARTPSSIPKKEEPKKQGVAEVAGPKNCWPGHRKVGTQPGTGKNAGKRVNDCEKIKKDGVAEGLEGKVVFSGTGANGGKYEIIRHGDDFMIRANGKHIDSYGSLQRAMGVLKNEVPGLKQGVAEGLPGSLSNSDYTPGATVKNPNTSCKRCHGHGTLWKAPDGTILPANDVPGAKRYKCGACDGIGMAKQGVAEGSDQLSELKKSTVKSYASKKQAEIDDVPPLPFKKPAPSNAEHEKNAKGMMGALARLSGVKPTSKSVSEVSDATKQNYKAKAQAQVRELEPHAKKGEYKDIAQRAIDRRQKGLDRVKDVAEDSYIQELTLKMAEKLDPNADPDVWVQDFQQANPNKYHQFKNKTPEKKAQMAIAARYAAKQPKSKR